MRVGLVTYALRVGGVETFLHNLAGGLRAQGHEVTFIETEHAGEWGELTRHLGYPVVSLPRRACWTRTGHCARIVRALAIFDVLLVNDAPLAMAALSALPPTVVAIPVLHTALASMIDNAASAGGQWQRIVTVAPGLLGALAREAQTSSGQAICIPNGVPLHPVRTKQSHPDEPLAILYVGRLEQSQKNVLAIPSILRRVMDQGVDVVLEVVGDGPDALELDRRLSEVGLRYVLSGHLDRSEVIERMHRADVLLMPSFYEGLPMTLLEAMSCGVTPVASKLAGSTDIVVESGFNGVLLEPADDAGFAGALTLLARDRKRLATMARCAQETIRSRFSVDAMVSAYLNLMRECVDEGLREPPKRTGRIDDSMLGDFTRTPYALVRVFRKLLRLLGLYPKTI